MISSYQKQGRKDWGVNKKESKSRGPCIWLNSMGISGKVRFLLSFVAARVCLEMATPKQHIFSIGMPNYGPTRASMDLFLSSFWICTQTHDFHHILRDVQSPKKITGHSLKKKFFFKFGHVRKCIPSCS